MVSGSRMSIFCTRARYRFLTEVGPLAFSNVYLTSSAVKGVPSCQVTFGRSLKRHLVGVGLSQLSGELRRHLEVGPGEVDERLEDVGVHLEPGVGEVGERIEARHLVELQHGDLLDGPRRRRRLGPGRGGRGEGGAGGGRRGQEVPAGDARAIAQMAVLLSSTRGTWECRSQYMEARARCKRGQPARRRYTAVTSPNTRRKLPPSTFTTSCRERPRASSAAPIDGQSP